MQFRIEYHQRDGYVRAEAYDSTGWLKTATTGKTEGEARNKLIEALDAIYSQPFKTEQLTLQ